MKIRFEDKMNNSYMVICPDKSEAGFSGYMYRMILENRIKGLIPCRTGNLDGRGLLYYNITGLLRVSDYMREHTADENFLRSFLRELSYAAEELQKYLIGSESIMLDPEQIFISADTGAFRFAVCFEDRCTFSENLLKFSEYLIPRLPNNNHTAAAMGYELYQSCISGQAAAAVLRRIASCESRKDGNARNTENTEGEKAMIISEEDIFIPRSERRKKAAAKKGSVRSQFIEKTAVIKEKISAFFHSLTV